MPLIPRIPIEKWSEDHVVQWLKTIGLTQMVPEFRKRKVDGRTLLKLDKNDRNAMQFTPRREKVGIAADPRVPTRPGIRKAPGRHEGAFLGKLLSARQLPRKLPAVADAPNLGAVH